MFIRTRPRHRRGTALVLTIIVAIVITALVSAMCWVAGESAQRTASLSKVDQAFFAAEAGAQRVQWYCKNGQMASITSPLTGTVNGDSYSVSWSTVSGTTILITSVGSKGTVSYTVSQQVTPPASAQPAITSIGNFNNKNIDVVGDVVVSGNYSNGGSGSLSGNLTYYGTATNTGIVSGTVTHASGSPATIDFAALGATLIAAAGTTYTGPQNSKTFDFTAIPGTNKVIYVDGDVGSPTFIGTGTLYVHGRIANVDGFGSAGSPVHLVASGDITTTNNNTFYGSIYTANDWNRGKVHLTGMVYTVGIVQSNNGASDITQGATPWFDPRSAAGGSGGSATTVTAFAGPMP